MLIRNHRQEGLCRAYVHAIAARCGMSISLPSPDYGIDLTLNDIVIVGSHRIEPGYKLDVQAKSTTLASLEAGQVRYDLDVKSYLDSATFQTGQNGQAFPRPKSLIYNP